MLRCVTAAAARLRPCAAQGTVSTVAAEVARAAPSALSCATYVADRRSLPTAGTPSESSRWRGVAAAALGAGLAGYASVGSAKCAGEQDCSILVHVKDGDELLHETAFYPPKTAEEVTRALEEAGYKGGLLDSKKFTLTGKDKVQPSKEAYTLRVPPQHGQLPGRKLGPEEPMVKFVGALLQVRQQILNPVAGTVITLQRGCVWMGNVEVFSQQLYVRACYVDLLAASQEYRARKPWLSGTLIAGTPGVGKSHLAALVVAKLLLDKRVVMLQIVRPSSLPGGSPLYYRLELTEAGRACVRIIAADDHARQWLEHDTAKVRSNPDKAPAYVVDGGVPGLQFGQFPNIGQCFWQFASANRAVFAEVNKGAAYLALYPPLFNLQELIGLKGSIQVFEHLTDDQVTDGYALLGGIARTVLLAQARNTRLADLKARIQDKIMKLGEAGIKELFDSLKSEHTFHEGSDVLVHLEAEDEANVLPRAGDSPQENKLRRYTKTRVQIASPYVGALLAIHLNLARAEQAALFAISLGTKGGTGGIVGKVHEELGHMHLATGGTFECRLLPSGQKFTLTLPRSNGVEVFQTGAEAAEMAAADGSKWFMPALSNYPAIDALKNPATLFQMAAGPKHSINRPGLLKLFKAFNQSQMDAAMVKLREMTGLQLRGRKPMLFFATTPEAFDDGYTSLQLYTVDKRRAAQSALVHQAVLKVPHQLTAQLSPQGKRAVIDEVLRQMKELAVEERSEEEEVLDDEVLPDWVEK